MTGVNPGLGGATKPITQARRRRVQGATGNNLGGHAGNVQNGVNGLLGQNP